MQQPLDRLYLFSVSPASLPSISQHDHKNVEGFEVDGKAGVFGSGVVVSYEGDSTKITFTVLEEGKKRVVLVRI